MRVYRADSGYDRSCHTAAEIVRYEIEELGNNIGVSQDMIEFFEFTGVRGDDIVWVCFTPEHASRYGEPEAIYLPPDSELIGYDNEHGYLFWIRA